MWLSKDMRELLRLLQKHQVTFAVCGGFAVAYHGHVRMTADFDLLIGPDRENARRLMAALREFGFGHAGFDEEGLTRPGVAITLGVQPNQIDLLTSMSSQDTAEVLRNAEAGELGGFHVKFVSRDDLIRAKREAARPKDLSDVEELCRPPPHP